MKIAIGVVLFCFVMMASGMAWCGDNGDGTVTVNGLVWLKDTRCMGKMNLDDAKAKAKSLASGQCGLSDNSKAGDWSLPRLEELKAIYSSRGAFSDFGYPPFYWSRDRNPNGQIYGWVVYMDTGVQVEFEMVNIAYVWPFRSVK